VSRGNGGSVAHLSTIVKVKYASGHDLRRSFGERWVHRVMSQVLSELMRHEFTETTLKFYVGRNAERTAATLRTAVPGTMSGTFGNGNCQTDAETRRLPEAS
jgi:integrase